MKVTPDFDGGGDLATTPVKRPPRYPRRRKSIVGLIADLMSPDSTASKKDTKAPKFFSHTDGGSSSKSNNEVEDFTKGADGVKALRSRLEFMVIDVHSTPKGYWDAFVLLLVLYNSVMIPWELCFQPCAGFFTADSPECVKFKTLSPFDTFVDFCFFFDILSSFLHAYVDNYGIVVTSHKMIARRYVKGWFTLDLFATIPFEWFFHEGGVETYTALLKGPRLLRLGRFMKKLDKLYSANFFRVLKILIGYVLINHWVACLFYSMSRVQIFEADQYFDSWIAPFVDEGGLYYGVGLGTLYIQAFYWSMTVMTTIGFGDIVPKTVTEKFFTIFIEIIGACFFAVIFGNIAALIQSFDSNTAMYRERLKKINDFARYNELPNRLAKRMRDYVEYWWTVHKGFNQNEIYEDLPETLRSEISMFLHEALPKRVPIFQDCDRRFIRSIVLRLQPQVCLPEDYIVTEGEVGNEMYFLRRGDVDIVSGDGQVVYKTMSDGAFFGEISMLTGTRRTASVRASTYCDLYYLKRKDFLEVLAEFPEYKQQFKEVARNRLTANASLLKTQDVRSKSVSTIETAMNMEGISYRNGNPITTSDVPPENDFSDATQKSSSPENKFPINMPESNSQATVALTHLQETTAVEEEAREMLKQLSFNNLDGATAQQWETMEARMVSLEKSMQIHNNKIEDSIQELTHLLKKSKS